MSSQVTFKTPSAVIGSEGDAQVASAPGSQVNQSHRSLSAIKTSGIVHTPQQQQQNQRRPRHSGRKFLATTLRQLLLTTSASIPAFLIAVICDQTNNGDLYLTFNGNWVRACFDIVCWTTAMIAGATTYALVYQPIFRDWHVRAVMGTFPAMLTVLHLLNASGMVYATAGLNPVASSRPIGVFLRHISFFWVNILIPGVFKWRIHVACKENPSLFPPQKRSYVFPTLLVAMVVYWSNYLFPVGLMSAAAIVVSLVLGSTIAVLSYTKLVPGGHYRRHFDLLYLLTCGYHALRSLSKVLLILLGTSLGRTYATWLIFMFRFGYGWLTLYMDDMMPTMLGSPILWGSYFARLGEEYASLAATLNFPPRKAELPLYFLLNLSMLLTKDCGLMDDFRFYLSHRFWIASRPSAFLKPATSRDQLNAMEHGAQKMIPSRLSSATSRASSAVTSDMRSMRSILQQSSANRLVRKSSVASVLSEGSGSELGLAFIPASPDQPARVVMAQRLHKVEFDLRLQISRSEQTTIARLTALVVVSACLGITSIVGRTNADKLVRPVTANDWSTVCLTMGTLGFQILVARAFSAIVFRWKINKLKALAAELGEPVLEISLWRTSYPRGNTHFKLLVQLVSVFVTIVTFGPWTI
ncbi:hypothetical protein BC828DRAFT_374302 [Blastocladiella britannica]|nr:hypothetical protein BC828DRAFT_374302 [Blastocladiella britannica]